LDNKLFEIMFKFIVRLDQVPSGLYKKSITAFVLRLPITGEFSIWYIYQDSFDVSDHMRRQTDPCTEVLTDLVIANKNPKEIS